MFLIKSKPITTVSAIITRADGTVVDLGVIASTKQSFLTRLFKILFGKRRDR